MSEWINKDLFNEFQDEKKNEADAPPGGNRRSDLVWKTPEKGTVERAKVYEGRLLPDKKGNFYKKYFYHMFQSGETWTFTMCPKTFNFDNFCPLCLATSKLYMGTAADKKVAYNYKRKEKFVGNFFIVSDPRDQEREDDDDKVEGSIRLYEFPAKVERKLKEEITDTRNGLGASIFDPGEGGYNFILKVTSTKKDRNGNIWPDYSSSTFSRRSSALGTDNEIRAIMESTIDLDEYLESLKKEEEEVVKLVKSEMLWDLIKDDYNRLSGFNAAPTVEDDLPSSVETDDRDVIRDEELSDADLLAELESL